MAVGLTMACGQMLGAYTGSNLVARYPVKFARYVFMVVIFVLLIKLFKDAYL